MPLQGASFIRTQGRTAAVIGIVVSDDDGASRRIGDALLAQSTWEQCESRVWRTTDGAFSMRQFDDLHLNLERVDEEFSDPAILVFVSRHAGDTGPLLTAHFPGNVGSADYGGEPHTVPTAAPQALSQIYSALNRFVPDGFDVGIECTHHGPSRIDTPCLFVEIGSGPEQWNDDAAAAAVAKAVLRLEPVPHQPERTIIGIGGSHYAPRFERILASTPWTIGHIAADWALDEVPANAHEATLTMLFDRSGANRAVIDGTYPGLEKQIEECGYAVVSETWLRETGSTPLPLVTALENALGSIDAGTRIGSLQVGSPEDLRTLNLPNALLSAAEGVDRAATVAAIDANSVAYGTRENGNRLRGDVLIPADMNDFVVVESLRPILEDGYDAVHITDTEISIEKRRFDPDKATKRGVSEGPLFGKLANGEVIEINGKEIHPSDVATTEVETIAIGVEDE